MFGTKSKIIICLCVLLHVQLYSVDAVGRKCDGDVLLPEVDTIGCSQEPCKFYHNKNATMIMRFRSPRYLETFKPQAVAIISGVRVNYPLGVNDGCPGLTNTPCPVARREYIEYTFSMFVQPVFPKVSLELEFSLLDANDVGVACFKILAQVTD